MPRKPKLAHDGFGYHITTKGYARFSVKGPMHGMYVHRYEAEKMLGRKLRKDEEVHHRNFVKLDWSHCNLQIKGQAEHSWYSAKQAFWMRLLDIKAERHFYDTICELEAEGVNTGLIQGGGLRWELHWELHCELNHASVTLRN